MSDVLRAVSALAAGDLTLRCTGELRVTLGRLQDGTASRARSLLCMCILSLRRIASLPSHIGQSILNILHAPPKFCT